MHPGFDGHPASPPAARRPGGRSLRRVLGSALGLYSGLTVAAAALAALLWSSTLSAPEEPPPSGAADSTVIQPENGESSPATASDPSGGGDRERVDPPDTPADTPEHPDRPSGEAALRANPLYDTGRLAPRPCPVPDVDVTEPDEMEEFLHTLTDCLDEAWTTQFERAGVPFEPPARVFWSEPGTSPCRDYPSDAGAFYCRASNGIYIGVADVVEKWREESNGVVYASLLAHEYGHHVQGESGLLEYYHEQRRHEPDTAEQNTWTRRSELQANCLAGVFLGSIGISYPITDTEHGLLREDAKATADRGGSAEERTHGTPANSALWLEHGLAEQRPGACNTWEAAPELVE